jgi:hypothetical protein
MKGLSIVFFVLAAFVSARAGAGERPAPRLAGLAPVVHADPVHVLSAGRTAVVLDGRRGLSLSAVGTRPDAAPAAGEAPGADIRAALRDAVLEVVLERDGRRVVASQAHDPSPRLQVISQGPAHVAARAFFDLRSEAGESFGTGTMDLYLYEGRLHLAPSVFVDDVANARVVRAGFRTGVALPRASLRVGDAVLRPERGKASSSFGAAAADFSARLEGADGAVRLGWLRNVYPPFPYLREVARNPETDDLYEKWPPWISQRGAPLGWRLNETSGLRAAFEEGSPTALALNWTDGRAPEASDFEKVFEGVIAVSPGGYLAFNGVLAVFLGPSAASVDRLWEAYRHPVRPAVERGDFRFFNEFENLYEVDTRGGETAIAFDGRGFDADRPVVLRLWNLEGKGGAAVSVDGEPVPVALLNDGGLLDDPMVSVVKAATGPARQAVVAFTVRKDRTTRVALTRRPGLQLAYQMYSELEAYEGWSDECGDRPLFFLPLRDLAIYRGRLPGRADYAFFKLPLSCMKNGVNTATFMNRLRGFRVSANGPEEIRFAGEGVNLQATGLSAYEVRIPWTPGRLRFEVEAAFTPLDDGRRWTSIEYCDFYPFEGVRRADFHFRDVVYLRNDGTFDRVGAGAWSGSFRTVEEPERLGYHAESVKRTGPGGRIPDPAAGSVWLLGDSPGRGNILFRRTAWNVTPSARPAFTLCNAWMDIHNALADRGDFASGERVGFAIEVFPGRVPSTADLDRIYDAASGGAKRALRVSSVAYSSEGSPEAFTLVRD